MTIADSLSLPVQVPFIKHGSNIVPDTSFIIRYLQNTYGCAPDSALQPLTMQQQALNTVCTTLVEEVLVPVYQYCYFELEQVWMESKVFFRFLPWPLGSLGAKLIRADFHQRLWTQGMGRHSYRDISIKAHEALQALSTILGEKPYLSGDSPAEADASLFAWTDRVLHEGIKAGELPEMTRQYPNLVLHCQRIREDFWPEMHKHADETGLPDKKAA